jgi:hypothetical protein
MEIWKPAFGFEGIYDVSTTGRVRRVLAGQGARQGAIIRPHIAKGYFQYGLRKNRRRTNKYAHRLVLQTFVCNSHLTANHKNGDRTDNRVENLEWISCKENLLHACRILGKRRGGNHWNAGLTESVVPRIRALYADGISPKKIAEKYGVSRNAIYLLLQGKTWKHV